MARVAWDNEPNPETLCTLANAGAENIAECLDAGVRHAFMTDDGIEMLKRHPVWRPEMYETYLKAQHRS